MKKIWWALLFLFGAISSELRAPTHCETVNSSRQGEAGPRKRR
jgi:hypothetical protein